jgi:hypothetical protein
MLPSSQIMWVVYSISSGPFGARKDIRIRRTEGEVEHHQGGPTWATWSPGIFGRIITLFLVQAIMSGLMNRSPD